VGRRRDRTGGGTAARWHRGPAIPVEELEIGWLDGLQWVVRVLFVLRIRGGERRWGLSTVRQEARRWSGERWWSEQERLSEMCVCKRESECARSFRGCSGSRGR
jgi:hypothetical protein